MGTGMSTRVQTLNLVGKEFVVLERSEYDRLRALEHELEEAILPPLPPAKANGNRPALEFVRATIARDIIKERTALGLSQQELAKLAGIRQETLCRLETGKHSPNVRTVDLIDRALQQEERRQKSSRGKGRGGRDKNGK
jgi:DNA-binding XRE family transcriptional regulator